MSTARAAWFVPFRHVVPADLERWFEQRAAEGLFAEWIRQWGSLRMTLTRRAPATYRYVVDAQPALPRSDYRTTYEDLGWEYVGQMASIHVWRRAYDGERPEAFTDRVSSTGRNLRFASAAGIAAALLLIVAVALAVVAASAGGAAGTQLWLAASLSAVIGVAVAAAAVAIVRGRNR